MLFQTCIYFQVCLPLALQEGLGGLVGWGLAGAGSGVAGLGRHANGDGWPNLGNLSKGEGCPDQGGLLNIDECLGMTRESNVNTNLCVALASVVV